MGISPQVYFNTPTKVTDDWRLWSNAKPNVSTLRPQTVSNLQTNPIVKPTTQVQQKPVTQPVKKNPSKIPEYEQFRKSYYQAKGWQDYGDPSSFNYGRNPAFAGSQEYNLNPALTLDMEHNSEATRVYKQMFGSGAYKQSGFAKDIQGVLPATSKLINPSHPKINWGDVAWDVGTVLSLGAGGAPAGVTRTAIQTIGAGALTAAQAKNTAENWKQNPAWLNAVNLGLTGLGAAGTLSEATKLTPYIKKGATALSKSELATSEVGSMGLGGKPLNNMDDINKSLDDFGEAMFNPNMEKSRKIQQELRASWNKTRFTEYGNEVEKLIASGRSETEAYQMALSKLEGKAPIVSTGIAVTQDVKNAAYAKIRQMVQGEAEQVATIQAFNNAIEGKPIPDIPGIKGGSAQTRLLKVFGDNPLIKKIIQDPEAYQKWLLEHAKNPAQLDSAVIDYLRNLPAEDVLFGRQQLELNIPETPNAMKGISRVATPQETLNLKLELAGQPQTISPIGDISTKFQKQLALMSESARITFAKRLQKVGVNVVDLLNIPRTIQTMWDVSYPARQGLVAGVRHPINWLKSWKPMLQALRSDEVATKLNNAIIADPDVARAIAKGWLDPLSLERGASYMQRPESFASKIAEKYIPGARMSQRSASVFSNKLMAENWKTGVNILKKLGADETEYKALGEFINQTLGRGTIPKGLISYAPTMNAILYSPRLLFSRLQLPAKLFSSSPMVRKEAWSTLVALLAFGTSVLSMAKLAGAKVESDPRSSDFGKIVVGNTRLDIWGGYIQYARMAAQLATGERKTAGGEIIEQPWQQTLLKMAQTKESPMFGLLTDVLSGQTYYGAKNTPASQAYEKLVPLALQDFIDGLNANGITGGLLSTPSIVGVGVQTYEPEASVKLKNEVAKEAGYSSWEELGLKKTKLAQQKLIDANPELQKAIGTAEANASKNPTANQKIWVEYDNDVDNIEKQYQTAILNASKKFRSDGDGYAFKEAVGDASSNRSSAYDLLQNNKRYQVIRDYFNEPKDPTKTNYLDIARDAYYKMMYGTDMRDEYGEYDFEKAEINEAAFVAKYGQKALDYVNEWRDRGWKGTPELQLLEQVRVMLKPYWDIEEQEWAKSNVPNLRGISDAIDKLKETNEQKARLELYRYPQIAFIKRQILLKQRLFKLQHPEIAQYLKLFYYSF